MENGAYSSLARTNALAKHENISAASPDGTVIFIDRSLSRLLPAIWNKGMETRFSCGGGASTNPNYHENGTDLYGYIFFETEKCASAFMEETAVLYPTSIYPYFLETHGGIPNRIVRFDTRMIPMFETVFCPSEIGTRLESEPANVY